MADAPARRRIRVLAAGLAVALVAALTVLVRTSASAEPGEQYRLATVGKGDVEQRLDLTGAVKRVSQKTATFPVSGSVSTVKAALGDTVKAGQTLASLDTTNLEAAVLKAKATLAQAKATLESDQNGTSASDVSLTSALSSLDATSAKFVSAALTSDSGSDIPAAVLDAQQAVASAQQTAASDLAASQAAHAAMQKACSAMTSSKSDALADCQAALATAQSAQNTAAESQQKLASAQSALTDALTAWAQDLAQTPTPTTPSPTTTTPVPTRPAPTTTQPPMQPTSPSTGRGSGGQNGSTSGGQQGSGSQNGSGSQSGQGGGQSSAARIAADEAAVAEAQSALDDAETNLSSATLRAPISGTVAAIGLIAGSAASSDGITIIGAGAAEVTVDVPLASLKSLRIGQTASVTPAGGSKAVEGTVSSISLLPADSTTDTPSYPVVVLVPTAGTALSSGSRAQTSIAIGSASDAITVPNSAITKSANGTASVTTLVNGQPTRTTVALGIVGPNATQVKSGLKVGQQVVLADLSADLPSNSSATSRFGGGQLGTQFGGGQFGGGSVGPGGGPVGVVRN